ncbi:MAG: hypothetical protein WAZ12_00825 [Candidatus Absconditicoccaceae bacterium]
MNKLLQDINTKGKSTTLIIRDILLDYYKNNVFYKKFYEALSKYFDDISDNNNMEPKGTNEEIIDAIDQESKIQFMELFKKLNFNGEELLEANKFVNVGVKATEIEKGKISRQTLNGRLKDFFVFEKRKEGRITVLYLKPNLEVLGNIAIYSYFKASKFNQSNMFLRIVNILEAS